MTTYLMDSPLIAFPAEHRIDFAWSVTIRLFGSMAGPQQAQSFMNSLAQDVPDYATSTAPDFLSVQSVIASPVSILPPIFEPGPHLLISRIACSINVSDQSPLLLATLAKQSMLEVPSRVDFVECTAIIRRIRGLNYSVLNSYSGGSWLSLQPHTYYSKRTNRRWLLRSETLSVLATMTGDQGWKPMKS